MSIIQNAAKGRRNAMEALASSCETKVFYVAQCLLLDGDLAGSATAAAFKELWQGLKNKSFLKEEEPCHYTLIKAAETCKNRISKQNPKAFRLPAGKDFTLPATMAVSSQHSAELGYLLANLPPIQRFVFVLHTVGCLDKVQIGRVLGLDSDSVEKAMEAEKINLERLQKLSKKEFSSSYEQISAMLIQGEAQAQLPQKAREQILAGIDHIALPREQKRKKQLGLLGMIGGGLLAVAAVCAIIFLIPKGGSGDADSTRPTLEAVAGTYAPPALEADKTYYADIEIKDYGKITVKLDQNSAPISAANFVKLANEGFYSGLTFHRIIEGFMMQGGAPKDGDDPQNIMGEFSSNGYDNPLEHTRGAISMARAQDMNSASSQFFIVHEDSPHLNGDYAAFGYVTEGMDVVDKVCESAQPTDNNGTIPAAAQPVITSVTIRTV